MKYFILSPNKDDDYGKASRAAMLIYADYIAPHDGKLAKDLRAIVIKIETQLGNKTN